MAIGTGNFAKLLWPGLNEIYGIKYNEHKKEYPEIFDFYKSTKAFEEDMSATGFSMAPIIRQGAGVTYEDQSQGFINRYTAVKYGKGFIITIEMYEDNQYKLPMINRATALAFSLNQTKETVAANILNRGFNSDYVYGDGVELLADDHPNVSGGTWSNELTTASDLNQDALEQACIDIAKFENDKGLKVNLKPVKLIIPSNLMFDAEKLLMSPLDPESANNAVNAIRSMGKIPQGAFVNHYLTDEDAWFIKTDCPSGLKHFERKADTFKEDNDFDTDNAKFKATGRYSFGCSDAMAIFGSPGS